MGDERVTVQNLQIVQVDPGAQPRRAARRDPRHPRGDHDQEARRRAVTHVDIKNVRGEVVGSLDLDESAFWDRAEPGVRPPGRRRAARERAQGHPRNQDARRGRWRHPQDVAPEGHWTRTSGRPPCPALGGRWHRLRPTPALLSAVDAAQDAALGHALGAVGAAGRRDAVVIDELSSRRRRRARWPASSRRSASTRGALIVVTERDDRWFDVPRESREHPDRDAGRG